ncbi:unnamed protein product [Allacma fusca]|uniref:Uncharacterized protein n=1 Tax=Allacma fusca TaxID=39272 RepID=A0A8J2NTB4_9HEXA|nr:unnamed protein product [Allacma fusca]
MTSMNSKRVSILCTVLIWSCVFTNLALSKPHDGTHFLGRNKRHDCLPDWSECDPTYDICCDQPCTRLGGGGYFCSYGYIPV